MSMKYSDINVPPHHLPCLSGESLSHFGQRTAANQGNSPSSANCPLATAGMYSGFLPHNGYTGNFARIPEVHMDMSKINTDVPMLGQIMDVYQIWCLGLLCTLEYPT